MPRHSHDSDAVRLHGRPKVAVRTSKDRTPPHLQESGSGCGHGGPWEAVRTGSPGAASAASFDN
jgi:hypothetical protein